MKSIQHIGKEANKWEEQFFTGFNPDAQIEYGICPEQRSELLQTVLQAITTHGAKGIADIAKLTERHVLDIGKGRIVPPETTLAKLASAAKALVNANVYEHALRLRINAMMEEQKISIRSLAASLEIDPSNLAKIFSGRRNAGDHLIRAHEYLMSRATLGYDKTDER